MFSDLNDQTCGIGPAFNPSPSVPCGDPCYSTVKRVAIVVECSKPVKPPPPPPPPLAPPPASKCITWVHWKVPPNQPGSPPANLLETGHQCVPFNPGSMCANPTKQTACVAGPDGHAGHWDDADFGAARRRAQCGISSGAAAPSADFDESFVATAVAGQNLTWQLSATGAVVPPNAVHTAASQVLVRSMPASGVDGDVVTGWSAVTGGKLGPANFDDYGAKVAGDFQVALCGVPPPPPPPPPPTPPKTDRPYIRFAMALPANTTVEVDCTITQANGTAGHNTTYTWKGYQFGVSGAFASSSGASVRLVAALTCLHAATTALL